MALGIVKGEDRVGSAVEPSDDAKTANLAEFRARKRGGGR
jgi:hypothetical protein